MKKANKKMMMGGRPPAARAMPNARGIAPDAAGARGAAPARMKKGGKTSKMKCGGKARKK